MSNRPQPTNPELEKIETFLRVNALEITEPYRAKIREAAAKAIAGEPIRLNHCPEHLRDALRRIIIEAAYQSRVRGQNFNVNTKKEWI